MKKTCIRSEKNNPAPFRSFFEHTQRVVSNMMVVGVMIIEFIIPAHAAVFNIVSGDASGFIEAIVQSNANGEADTIHMEAGVYALNVVNNVTDGANGLPSITSVIQIVGAGTDTTIIERMSVGATFRLLHIGTSGKLSLSNVTIENGHALEGNGGGILNRGIAELQKVKVNQNLASSSIIGVNISGGGICNLDGELDLNDVTIESNQVEALTNFDSLGGGISNSGKMNLVNVSVSNNLSPGAGGGIYNETGEMALVGVTITDNLTAYRSQSLGGGIYNKSGLITLSKVTISGNPAGVGGGIVNAGTMQLTEVAVHENTAEDFAGGIFNSGKMDIDMGTISNNQQTRPSGEAGGLSNNGEMAITNTTISGNAGAIYGGGILNNGDLSLVNVTIAANAVMGIDYANPEGNGCAITNFGSLIATGTLVDRCSTSNACDGALTSDGRNLDGDGSCGFTEIGDLSGVDPMLGPLQDNGGYSWTHSLLPGSPAIDAGGEANLPVTDQRGIERPQDGDGDGIAINDMGAVEYDAPIPQYAKICASLGDHKSRYLPDVDIFKLSAHRGETIIVDISEDSSGHHNGLEAKLLLACWNRTSYWSWRETGPFPLQIEKTLSKTAKCGIVLIQEKLNPEGFQGDYCLDLESSDDAWKSLTATTWTE